MKQGSLSRSPAKVTQQVSNQRTGQSQNSNRNVNATSRNYSPVVIGHQAIIKMKRTLQLILSQLNEQRQKFKKL